MTAPAVVGTVIPLMLPGADEIPVTEPRAPAREAAERELSDPRYQGQEPGLLQRALDRVWDGIGDLLEAATGAAPGEAVGLATVVTLLVLLVIAVRIRLGPLRRTAEHGAPVFAGRPMSAAEHRDAADQHAAAGRWNTACQERMRAIIRSLEERALLDPSPGRTADEAAAQAALALPAAADRLRDAAWDFDGIRYGGHQATRTSYARLAELDQDLQRTTPLLPSVRDGGR